jgi:hypothetical protein
VADHKDRLVQGDKGNELKQGESRDERERKNSHLSYLFKSENLVEIIIRIIIIIIIINCHSDCYFCLFTERISFLELYATLFAVDRTEEACSRHLSNGNYRYKIPASYEYIR